MLVGMALLKLRVLTAARPTAFYRRVFWWGLFLGLPITIFGTWRDFAHHWEFVYGFFSRSAIQLLGELSPGVRLDRTCHGNCALRSRWSSNTPHCSVGRMAVSNYILDSLLCTALCYGYGFGLLARCRVWDNSVSSWPFGWCN